MKRLPGPDLIRGIGIVAVVFLHVEWVTVRIHARLGRPSEKLDALERLREPTQARGRT
jgi:hypothetical protein